MATSESGAQQQRTTQEPAELTLKEQAGTEAKAQPATHRCRIYRLSPKGLRKGMSLYTVVWETSEHPLKNEALPRGEVVFDLSNPSPALVEAEIERFSLTLGRAHIADWQAVGSF